MAEGGTDSELAELGERFSKLKASDKPDQTQETNFTDDSTQYNIGDYLVDTSTFSSPKMFHSGLEKKEYIYTKNEDKLKEAMDGTKWAYTEEGLRHLSARVHLDGRNIYYEPMTKLTKEDVEEIRAKDKRLVYEVKGRHKNIKAYALCLTKKGGTFYAEGTMQSKYGVHFADEVHSTLYPKSVARAKVASFIAEAEKMWGPHLEAGTSEPSKSQPQQLSPELQRYLDELNQPRVDPIKRLIDTNEDELGLLGFSDDALREWRGLIKTSEDFAAVKRDKDIQIQELEKKNQELGKKVNDLVTEYINTTALDVADKDELEKEIGELKKEKEEVVKKLVIERKKAFELRTEEESQINRMKSLITDVLKNPESEIPLKDRIKLLFKIEGLTVGAIILAIVMTFTTLGLPISNSLKGSSPSPKPPTPSPSPEPEPDIPNKVKAGLKKFAEWLKELAKKSLSALPGIIGSIVSFIFKSAGAVVGFLAEHLIILGFIIVSSIIYGLVEGVSYIKQNHKVAAT